MLSALPLLLADVGRFELTVHVHSAKPQAQQLTDLFWAVADPNDEANYARHKTAKELRSLAGGTKEAVDEVSKWLGSLGGSGVSASVLGDQVTASFADKASTGPSLCYRLTRAPRPTSAAFTYAWSVWRPDGASRAQMRCIRIGFRSPSM